MRRTKNCIYIYIYHWIQIDEKNLNKFNEVDAQRWRSFNECNIYERFRRFHPLIEYNN
jgi:hypothetical protein